MKKLLFLFIGIMVIAGCSKHDVFPTPQSPTNALEINAKFGIKVETPFVTTEVAMNVKSETAQNVTIKIFDISNRVVSKENVYVQSGDNILKVYTNALPSSAYRIGFYDVSGKQLGITDFNKL